jgi:RHS repeat-associated protein
MPVTTYMNVGGRCIGEETDGVVSYYITEALGSVTHVVDESFAVVKTMRYKPYGEVLSRSGTMRDTVMQWVGSYGYRATSFPASSHYVRARHFSTLTGAWTTADPLFPDERAYGYVGGMPTWAADPSGLATSCQGGKPNPCSKLPKDPVSICIALACSLLGGVEVGKAIGGAGKGIPKGIPELIDHVKGIWGKPLTDIEGCCTDASKSSRVTDIGIIITIGRGRPSGKIKPPPPADIIKSICVALGSTKYRPEKCGLEGVGQEEGNKYSTCAACCEKNNRNDSRGESICKNLCIKWFPGD